jgi:signal peptidase I
VGSRTGSADESDVEVQAPTKSLLRDYSETILVCVIFLIFSRAFVFQQSKIPSGSMEETLLPGDYIMVNRFVYAPTSFDWERKLLPAREVHRGDVVVFKFPNQPEIDYIKRVIGLPGDTIELRNGYVFVNGTPIDEPYVTGENRAGDRRGNWGPRVVDPDHFLVMGDHRNSSDDSRAWGLVPAHLMKGRALLIWWSYPQESARGNPSTGEVLRSWGDKLVHLFTRSRWRRCFDLIH